MNYISCLQYTATSEVLIPQDYLFDAFQVLLQRYATKSFNASGFSPLFLGTFIVLDNRDRVKQIRMGIINRELEACCSQVFCMSGKKLNS